MDRELPQEYRQKRLIQRITWPVVVVLFLILSLWLFRGLLRPTIKRSTLRTAIAEIGSVNATITASGIITPEFEQAVASPVPAKIETILRRAGESVTQGESILTLNTQFITLQYQSLRDELDLIKNKKTQLALTLERALIDLQTNRDIQVLKIKSLESKLEQEQHLFELGGITLMAMEKTKLDLEIARRELLQIERQIRNQEKTLAADLKGLDLEIMMQEKNVETLERKMALAEARADRNGIVTWVNDNLGASVTEGEIIARIADLNSYQVQARISDMHAGKLHAGNEVVVRINDTDLKGRINNIRPRIENGIITFIIELEEKTNPALRQNMRVEVFVITSLVENVVRVRNGPFINGSGEQNIFVIEGDKAIRKFVDIGAINFDYVEIRNEIQPGDEVIISSMSDYKNNREIELE